MSLSFNQQSIIFFAFSLLPSSKLSQFIILGSPNLSTKKFVKSSLKEFPREEFSLLSLSTTKIISAIILFFAILILFVVLLLSLVFDFSEYFIKSLKLSYIFVIFSKVIFLISSFKTSHSTKFDKISQFLISYFLFLYKAFIVIFLLINKFVKN